MFRETTEACVTRSGTAVWKNTFLVQNVGMVDIGMTYGAGLQDELLFGLDVCLSVSFVERPSVMSTYSACNICVCTYELCYKMV